MDNKNITWEAAEHEFRERTADWFWTLGIIIVSGALTSLILGNFLFSIVILLSGFALFLFGTRKPSVHQFELSERGIRIGPKLYPYLTLRSFWVEDQHEHLKPKLLIKSQKPFVPHLVIPLGDLDPRSVHAYLLPYLQEEEQREPLAHHLFEWLGF